MSAAGSFADVDRERTHECPQVEMSEIELEIAKP